MSQGLPVQRVVNTSISLTATPASFRNFGTAICVGSTPGVIDIVQRKRDYSSIEEVAADFGTAAPEYLYAQEHFGQEPQPSTLSIARWAQVATRGRLNGAILTPAQRLPSIFSAITTGAMTLSVDGTVRTLTGLNFSSVTNLNGVASIIQAALVAAGATGAIVQWNGVYYRFEVVSGTTGTTSTLSYATSPSSAAITAGARDISILTGLSVTPNSAGANADAPIAGVPAETALSAAALLGDMFGDWYCMQFAPVTPLADSDAIAVAGYIQAAGQARICGFTTSNTAALDPTRSDDLGSVLQTLGYDRSFVEFSENNPYAAASIFATFATINYLGSNTTITGKFKLQPGVVPEYLTTTQADTLQEKNYNVYAQYQNGTAITQEAVMSSGTFIDSRINADWQANYAQTNVYNFIRSQPKVPQTDKGMGLIATVIAQSLQQGVVNGYLAEGTWNAAGFGTLNQGDTVAGGFYIFVPKVASQSETDRQLRKSVVFQCALKEAGAVHSADILMSVNP